VYVPSAGSTVPSTSQQLPVGVAQFQRRALVGQRALRHLDVDPLPLGAGEPVAGPGAGLLDRGGHRRAVGLQRAAAVLRGVDPDGGAAGVAGSGGDAQRVRAGGGEVDAVDVPDAVDDAAARHLPPVRVDEQVRRAAVGHAGRGDVDEDGVAGAAGERQRLAAGGQAGGGDGHGGDRRAGRRDDPLGGGAGHGELGSPADGDVEDALGELRR
jgi:hypothetical protein